MEWGFSRMAYLESTTRRGKRETERKKEGEEKREKEKKRDEGKKGLEGIILDFPLQQKEAIQNCTDNHLVGTISVFSSSSSSPEEPGLL